MSDHREDSAVSDQLNQLRQAIDELRTLVCSSPGCHYPKHRLPRRVVEAWDAMQDNWPEPRRVDPLGFDEIQAWARTSAMLEDLEDLL